MNFLRKIDNKGIVSNIELPKNYREGNIEKSKIISIDDFDNFRIGNNFFSFTKNKNLIVGSLIYSK
ncbi:MAG: hypothetical protein U0457_03920 [Candidatus Sericytochromatia bacterium]